MADTCAARGSSAFQPKLFIRAPSAQMTQQRLSLEASLTDRSQGMAGQSVEEHRFTTLHMRFAAMEISAEAHGPGDTDLTRCTGSTRFYLTAGALVGQLECCGCAPSSITWAMLLA
ncbi:unnamed protein product [Lota lota]